MYKYNPGDYVLMRIGMPKKTWIAKIKSAETINSEPEYDLIILFPEDMKRYGSFQIKQNMILKKVTEKEALAMLL